VKRVDEIATAILLNYKRPQNIKAIVDALRSQTVQVKIFLWNNNPEYSFKNIVDLEVVSSENLRCFPRWTLSSFAQTQYIFSLDDDLLPIDDDLIKKCCEIHKKIPEKYNPIIGATGVILNDNLNYQKSLHYKIGHGKDVRVDIVKGQFMFMGSAIFKHIPLSHEFIFEDDIYVSSYSKFKYLPSIVSNSFVELANKEESLWKSPGHFERRNEAVKKYKKSPFLFELKK
jgi:hypothetical protein